MVFSILHKCPLRLKGFVTMQSHKKMSMLLVLPRSPGISNHKNQTQPIWNRAKRLRVEWQRYHTMMAHFSCSWTGCFCSFWECHETCWTPFDTTLPQKNSSLVQTSCSESASAGDFTTQWFNRLWLKEITEAPVGLGHRFMSACAPETARAWLSSRPERERTWGKRNEQLFGKGQEIW